MHTADHFPLRRYITVTPFGSVFLVGQGRYLVGCHFLGSSMMPADMGIWAHPADPVLDEAATQLGQYARGEREYFDLPLAASGNAFAQRVWTALMRIPYGARVSYGQLAASLGNRRMARAVGQAVAANPLAIIIPCHRVVAADGTLGGFSAGARTKQALLAHEAHYRPDDGPGGDGQDLLF